MNCNKCGSEYEIRNPKGFRGCPVCKAAYDKQRRVDNPEAIARKVKSEKERKAAVQKVVIQYKKDNPCACGERRVPALQFDHRDQSTKIDSVSNLVGQGKSIEIVMEEIAKCDVVCANCHFMRTAEQLNWYETTGVDISLD